jgi:hypothetical protein
MAVNCHAAKKSYAAGHKVSVPAGILKGSAVASGRAFYKTNVPEDSLAGIRLGRDAKEILAKYGHPSRITLGTSESEQAGQGTPSGPAYTPPTANPYAALGAAAGMMGMPGMPGMPNPGALPGLPSLGQPGAGAMPGQQAHPVLSEEEVTWTYDLPSGITLEFIITDGKITQITVGGVGPYKASMTRTGLQLGDTYKLVLWVCGYPEKQSYSGRFLRVSYVNSNRALYTFLNKKVVGITIALVPEELK